MLSPNPCKTIISRRDRSSRAGIKSVLSIREFNPERAVKTSPESAGTRCGGVNFFLGRG